MKHKNLVSNKLMSVKFLFLDSVAKREVSFQKTFPNTKDTKVYLCFSSFLRNLRFKLFYTYYWSSQISCEYRRTTVLCDRGR